MKTFIKKIWLMAFTVLIVGCFEVEPPQTKALVYADARTLKPFELSDQSGNTVTNQDMQGQWNLLFLGYTHCPDICPMTLAKLNQAYQSLAEQHKLKVWFISVDPQRDTQAIRKQYVDYFNPEFVAATAGHKVLFPFVRDIGLIYAISDSNQGEAYSVDHSASVALVNSQGQLRAIFKPEFKVNQVPLINIDDLVLDFNAIANFYDN